MHGPLTNVMQSPIEMEKSARTTNELHAEPNRNRENDPMIIPTRSQSQFKVVQAPRGSEKNNSGGAPEPWTTPQNLRTPISSPHCASILSPPVSVTPPMMETARPAPSPFLCAHVHVDSLLSCLFSLSLRSVKLGASQG